MQGIHWARAAGYDLLEADEIKRHFREALLAPARSALPDFHLSGAAGLALRSLPGRGAVPRALGDRTRMAGPRRRARFLAGRALRARVSQYQPDALRRLAPRRRPQGARAAPARSALLVGAYRDGTGALARPGGALESTERAAGGPGTRRAPPWRLLRQPRVRARDRRTRTSRPAAPHPPRRRSALASRPGDRIVRRAGPGVVPLRTGPQRPPPRRRERRRRRRLVRGLRVRWGMGLVPGPRRRVPAHAGRLAQPAARRARRRTRGGGSRGAAVASPGPHHRCYDRDLGAGPIRAPLRLGVGAVHPDHCWSNRRCS